MTEEQRSRRGEKEMKTKPRNYEGRMESCMDARRTEIS